MSDERLVFPTKVIYPMMVEAHRKAAEAAAFHIKQVEAWHAAGKPVRESSRGVKVPDGFAVMSVMNHRDLEFYLEEQSHRIQYVSLSLSDNISLTYEEFMDYTQAKYSLRGDPTPGSKR